MATEEPPTALQRRQRYVYFFGEPVHVPTELFSIWPTCAVPWISGGEMLVGCAAGGVPAGETAAVGAEAAAALPAAEVAVTTALSEWPTSALTGLYVSAVAPEIGVKFEPGAQQRVHRCASES